MTPRPPVADPDTAALISWLRRRAHCDRVPNDDDILTRIADELSRLSDAAAAGHEAVGIIRALQAENTRLREALEQIAIAPCLYDLLGEDGCERRCPGCRSRAALAADGAR